MPINWRDWWKRARQRQAYPGDPTDGQWEVVLSLRPAAKKITGRKRFVGVDTQGLPLVVLVLEASLSESRGAEQILPHLKALYPARVRITPAEAPPSGEPGAPGAQDRP